MKNFDPTKTYGKTDHLYIYWDEDAQEYKSNYDKTFWEKWRPWVVIAVNAFTIIAVVLCLLSIAYAEGRDEKPRTEKSYFDTNDSDNKRQVEEKHVVIMEVEPENKWLERSVRDMQERKADEREYDYEHGYRLNR